ncbi:LysR family transcriptional regulator [Thalassomonas sp. M1454]|uniref:LysR family transcriptional regulator n=1 Tax=Thalassomonas sp. M1454 TaxID=2594477 RepID=UPI00117EA9A6|nr:LysR family transcriptional regulator [Thalassomonas sp. M1454]TRX57842.1 LysR family transcriptional regulator [Thalassomonas sp. M1454]
MLNPEQLKMLVLTDELGSFSACAKHLGKVQSAVSQGIANLEIDLNVSLFDRSTRKPTLTPEGLRLLDYAKAILRQNEELLSAAAAIDKAEEPQVTFAIDSALMLPKLADILKQFSEKFKVTRINLMTIESSQVATMVANGSADIGLMFADPNFLREIELCYIGNLPLYGVCRKSHPLAMLETVKAGDLIPHREILFKDFQQSKKTELPTFGAEHWYANNFHEIKTLVETGLGWAYIPEHMVGKNHSEQDLKKLNFSFDHKPWSPPIDCITQKNRAMGVSLTWLYEQLKGLLD